MRAGSFVALATLAFACGPATDVPDGSTPDSGDDASDVATDVYTGPVGLMLTGTHVTPDVVVEGEVLVIGQVIVCADVVSVCDAKPGAAHVIRIDTNGVIAPGLIDTHNHVLFDI